MTRYRAAPRTIVQAIFVLLSQISRELFPKTWHLSLIPRAGKVRHCCCVSHSQLVGSPFSASDFRIISLSRLHVVPISINPAIVLSSLLSQRLILGLAPHPVLIITASYTYTPGFYSVSQSCGAFDLAHPICCPYITRKRSASYKQSSTAYSLLTRLHRNCNCCRPYTMHSVRFTLYMV